MKKFTFLEIVLFDMNTNILFLSQNIFFCDSMLIHIRNVKIYMLKKNECTVVEEEAWIFFIWKKNLDEIKLPPIIGLIDPLSTRIGHVEILCFAHRIQQLIPELSNFTMGKISGIHHSTCAYGTRAVICMHLCLCKTSFPKIVPGHGEVAHCKDL